MLNPLDIIAPRGRQPYVGSSTRFRVMPRRVDWFGVVWCLVVLGFVLGFVGSVVATAV